MPVTGLAYIQAQDPEILKLRVELMQQENCDEFALNLCTWCLKHPALAGDFNLRRTQFVLLHQLSYTDKLQEEVSFCILCKMCVYVCVCACIIKLNTYN